LQGWLARAIRGNSLQQLDGITFWPMVLNGIKNATGKKGGGVSVRKEEPLLLLVLLIVLVLAAAPSWRYSRHWGYYPSGTLGTVLLILIILMLLGYVPL
jgi:hypothetical protein